jgi:mannose-6-phosphate isomerase-like protein (cupin superfamily)
MPELVTSPSRVPVPGGKVIEEFAGRASSGDDVVSVAVMTAPPGWSEPAQAPDFDEVTVVLAGSLVVEHGAGSLTVGAGQAVVTRAGERVRYSVGESGAHYVAVCVPAFALHRAHREASD